MEIASFYREKIDFYNKELKACKEKIFLFSVFRLLSFGALALLVYYLVQHYSAFLLVMAFIALAGFIILVRYAFKLNDKKQLLDKLLFVNTNELNILGYQPNAMEDGDMFSDPSDYSGDLDIFGKNSLYHLLNRCTTKHGMERLASILKHPLDGSTITDRQQALTVFAKQPEPRQLIIAYGLLNEQEEGNLYSIFEWLESGQNLHRKKWLQIVRWIIPLYAITGLLYYLATDNLGWLLTGVAAGWLVTGIHAKYIHRQHLLISKKQSILNQYARILQTFNSVQAGDSRLLKDLREISGGAYSAIGKLSRLSSAFDQRLNLVVNLVINSFFLYDMQCILRLDAWKEQHRKDFDNWLRAVGDIECLNAQATFLFNNPQYRLPQLSDAGQLYIRATQMGHPLIAEGERVANDFEAGNPDSMLLVTGSNMSGKTTFLRTLGVNLILAQSGAPVCATSFVFRPMHIYTSIRVSDSLQEHTSYFMAELKRLQHIIEQLKKGIPALVLIDEILRGTNSEDKTYGSQEFVRQLIQYNCITLFATHDLVLSTLEARYPGVISNYCFESTIQDDRLYFDYKLQRGVAKNKNASFLMKQMGIITD
ncbi:MAG: hypothetical protein KIT80_19770 [Chitinophagaceae bacterium]|nr:hypothetical protein [Chitinophagaceae bacterium]MCW5929168.1 hypothetical protein [Chitinophagaceae bacterium]